MSLDDPVVITCSISGTIANREQCPAIPYTPEEYAAEARRIVDEGGAMIHNHARRPDGTPSYEIEDADALQGEGHALAPAPNTCRRVSMGSGRPSSVRASATVAGRRPTSCAICRALAIRSPLERAISPSGR